MRLFDLLYGRQFAQMSPMGQAPQMSTNTPLSFGNPWGMTAPGMSAPQPPQQFQPPGMSQPPNQFQPPSMSSPTPPQQMPQFGQGFARRGTQAEPREWSPMVSPGARAPWAFEP